MLFSRQGFDSPVTRIATVMLLFQAKVVDKFFPNTDIKSDSARLVNQQLQQACEFLRVGKPLFVYNLLLCNLTL